MRAAAAICISLLALSAAVQQVCAHPENAQELLSSAPRLSLLFDAQSDSYLLRETALLTADELQLSEVAWGKWVDSVDTIGWALLEVHTNGSLGNNEQAFAAGVFEGQVSTLRIWQNAVNEHDLEPKDPKLLAWITQNIAWITAQVRSNPRDEYWHQVGLTERQLAGLHRGYSDKAAKGQELSLLQIRLASLGGDLGDLQAAVSESLNEHEHCSSIIKLLPDKSELFISQVTWSSLDTMLRVFKLYDFPYRMLDGKPVPAVKSLFSAYPASLSSQDDFYLLSSGLVAQETTIGVWDLSLYKKFTVPQTVLEWQRNVIANRLARSGKEWTDVFAKFNSGSYNNGWQILDYKLFTPGKPLPPNTLWTLEQIPGTVEAADVTAVLNGQGYWPGFNVAYFPRIFNMSGAPSQVAKYGDFYTYDKTARALMFKRDHTKVTDLASLKRLMRYNDFKNDPLARCAGCSPPFTGENAIACRSDLNDPNGTYPIPAQRYRNHAATDSKITSSALFKDFACVAASGPTFDQQPVFSWKTAEFPDSSHVGHPETFKFDYVQMKF